MIIQIKTISPLRNNDLQYTVFIIHLVIANLFFNFHIYVFVASHFLLLFIIVIL